MHNIQHRLKTNKSRIKLTKSSKTFVFFSFASLLLIASLVSIYLGSSPGILIIKLASFGLFIFASGLVLRQLTKMSDAYLMTDMIIIDPMVGKKLIAPIQGVVVKKAGLSGKFGICKVHVRLDGKKSVHYLYGKCEELIAENARLEDFLSELTKNKKVNHKPGSVSSVA